MSAVRVSIRGKVQNVWYRAWTTEHAKTFGLRGWVRNRSDGSVEALFIGAEETIKSMIEACRRGPPDARVNGIEEFAAEDDGSAGFTQRETE